VLPAASISVKIAPPVCLSSCFFVHPRSICDYLKERVNCYNHRTMISIGQRSESSRLRNEKIFVFGRNLFAKSSAMGTSTLPSSIICFRSLWNLHEVGTFTERLILVIVFVRNWSEFCNVGTHAKLTRHLEKSHSSSTSTRFLHHILVNVSKMTLMTVTWTKMLSHCSTKVRTKQLPTPLLTKLFL
jgi:hypothetical protein